MTAHVKASAGRFFPGFLVGLLVGLLLALGVALYVSKVPTPFVNKVPGRSAEQDAADAERARNWDPNAPLSSGSKSDTRSGSGGVSSEPSNTPTTTSPSDTRAAELLGVRPNSSDNSAAEDDPVSAKPLAAPLQYYVQIGAYARSGDAEQQRAKLAMSGLSARVTERDQGGRTMYRVRMGPYGVREDAESARDQAASIGYPDATLVPVQR